MRDYLETLVRNKGTPERRLPQDTIDKTAAKYHEAPARLTGAAATE